jgi:hypothetical protein
MDRRKNRPPLAGSLTLPAIRAMDDAPILRLTEYERAKGVAGPEVKLEIIRGKARERFRPVSGRVFLIGTASDCDLVLGDLTFPEVYAYLFVDGTKISIRRLGAGPALLVCGERTERAELLQGDEVRFGPFELRLIINADSPECGRPPRSASDPEHETYPEAEPALLRFSPPDHCAPWG